MSHLATTQQEWKDVWPTLEVGLVKILNMPIKSVERSFSYMSYEEYMNLYTIVINYCSKPSTASAVPLTQATGGGGARFVGHEVYESLRMIIRRHATEILGKLQGLLSHQLLEQYNQQWQRYNQTAKTIDHISDYLNRFWVKRMQADSKKDVYKVAVLMLVVWRDIVFSSLHEQLTKNINSAIEKERNGEPINSVVVSGVVTSYVTLGLENKTIYKDMLETPYIEATRTYYMQKSKVFLTNNSLVEYMKQVVLWLEEEELRNERYMQESSFRLIIEQCENVLIREHLPEYQEEFKVLLKQDKKDDLHRMFTLLSRLKEAGLGELRKTFGEYVKTVGLDAVESIASQAEEDPKVFIEKLLEIHSQYNAIVQKCFVAESGFVASLDKACREIVNKNAVCAKSTSKTSELLSRFVDSLLKKGSKVGDELEDILKNVMVVFKYVEDKDVFQKFYAKMFAKRLVQATSVSEDAEVMMITKLREACGSEYTAKLTKMVSDIRISKDLNQNFSTHLQNTNTNLGVDFSILVLCLSAWPLNTANTPFTLPEQLESAVTRFQQFYQNQHNGRKLNWLYHLSKGELHATYTPSSRAGYFFQVSTYQMGVLLQYNNAESLSLSDLMETTRLSDSVLKQILDILCKAKVLKQEGEQFQLNYDFKSKKTRINLNMPLKAEQKVEDDETNRTINEDRKLLIQAAIVRIMKTRKQVKYTQLVTEVIEQLKNRFKPVVPDIKRCIDILIEKEYMERAEGQNDVFNYIS